MDGATIQGPRDTNVNFLLHDEYSPMIKLPIGLIPSTDKILLDEGDSHLDESRNGHLAVSQPLNQLRFMGESQTSNTKLPNLVSSSISRVASRSVLQEAENLSVKVS